MSTRLHRFVPIDVNFVPTSRSVDAGLAWLRTQVDAYKIEIIAPGHVTFFDCGGGLDKIFCPICKADVPAGTWKDWMDSAWSEDNGFSLTSQVLNCCGASVRLDALGSDPVCAFGSFAVVITDTMKTLSDGEFDAIRLKLELMLGCRLQRVDAHY